MTYAVKQRAAGLEMCRLIQLGYSPSIEIVLTGRAVRSEYLISKKKNGSFFLRLSIIRSHSQISSRIRVGLDPPLPP